MCPSCRTFFSVQWCNTCNELVPTEKFTQYKSGASKGYLQRVCYDCNKAYKIEYNKRNRDKAHKWQRDFFDRQRAKAEMLYKKWLEDTTKVFRPMTEADWLEACAYFGGCALCGSEHIESREFFVQFGKGGRYTPWNMFPACAECSKHARLMDNPFIWLNSSINGGTKHLNTTKAHKTRLLQWLILQITKAGEEVEKGKT